MHAGRTLCDNEDRNDSNASTSQSMPELLANQRKVEEEPATDSPSRPQKEPTLRTP